MSFDSLSNAIAYGDKMILATGTDASPIRDVLGTSGWIDVRGASQEKWVPAEGEMVAQAFRALHAAGMKEPDVYVITPFRAVAAKMRKALLDKPEVLPHLDPKAKRDWLWGRIGTVHTFQGREAEGVLLVLGAGQGANQGSRNWAGATPNLLNVAATRAKKAIYVVGDVKLWRHAGYFQEAYRRLSWRAAVDVVAAWSRPAEGPPSCRKMKPRLGASPRGRGWRAPTGQFGNADPPPTAGRPLGNHTITQGSPRAPYRLSRHQPRLKS